MLNLYDIEITKKEYSTIALILEEANIKIRDKNQLDIIIYKFYNFTKNDIDYSVPVMVNELLVSKLNEFITKIDTLPNPNLESGFKSIHTFKANNLTLTDVIGDFMVVKSSSEHIFEDYKFVIKDRGSATSITMCFYLDFLRSSDGYGQKASGTQSLTVPVTATYYKLSIKTSSMGAYSTYWYFYDDNDELVYTSYYSHSSSYKNTDYAVKVRYSTTTKYDVECFKKIEYDFNIDTTIFNNLDYSSILNKSLTAEDVSYSPNNNIYFKNKFIDDVRIDEDYEVFNEYLGLIHPVTNAEIKFLTILKGAKDYLAILTTYAYHYAGVSSTKGDVLVDYSNTTNAWIGIKSFKSIDGFNWKDFKYYQSQGDYNADGYGRQRGDLSFFLDDYKVFYTNYPMFYAPYKHSNGTINSSLINTNYATNLYRNADTEKLVLDRLPIGARIKFGKHRTEGDTSPIIFKVLDYTNNISKNDNLPLNGVYLQTQHIIDYLALSPKSLYKNPNFMEANLHLMRWLNSEAGLGLWWEPLNSKDIPINEENIDSGYPFTNYHHRAGFLNNFSQGERNLLLPMEANGWSGKVSLLHIQDFNGVSSPSVIKPRYNRNPAFKNLYLDLVCSSHLNPDVRANCLEPFNEYASNFNTYQFWKRGDGSNGNYYHSNSSSSTAAGYTGQYIAPVITLDKNVEVTPTEDPSIFEVVVPKSEFETIDLVFGLERQLSSNLESSFSLKRDLRIDFIEDYSLLRQLGLDFSMEYSLERKIRNIVNLDSPLSRDLSCDIVKSFPTNRKANFRYIYSFATERKSIVDYDYLYPLERKIHANIDIIKSFELKREVLEDIIADHSLERTVLGSIDLETTILRKLREDIEREFGLNRSINDKRVYTFGLGRKLEADLVKDFKLRRRAIIPFEATFPLKRVAKEIHIANFNLERCLRQNIIKDFSMKRKTYIRKEVNIIAPISRYLVDRVDFIYTLKREILASIVLDTELLRKVLVDIMSDNNLEREVLEKESQYVSKENLDFYTKLLKQELDTFIDNKIEMALKKHNLI